MPNSALYNFSSFKKRLDEASSWLRGEFSSIRTGKASLAILDGIKVNSYGSLLPLNHVASITIEDPRTIRVLPWDKNQVRDIEQAIINSGLGLSVNVSDVGVRVIFPELTDERRVTLMKLAKKKHEEARVSLRGVRDEIWSDIQEKERKGEMNEDDKFRLKDEMQKNVDETNKKLDEMLERKEKEINS